LENPVPSLAGHLISATASFDLSLFIKIALQKEPWYPSRKSNTNAFPAECNSRGFLYLRCKTRKRAGGNPRDGFTDAFLARTKHKLWTGLVEGRCAIAWL